MFKKSYNELLGMIKNLDTKFNNVKLLVDNHDKYIKDKKLKDLCDELWLEVEYSILGYVDIKKQNCTIKTIYGNEFHTNLWTRNLLDSNVIYDWILQNWKTIALIDIKKEKHKKEKKINKKK